MARRTPGIYSPRVSGAGMYSPALNAGGNFAAMLLYVGVAAAVSFDVALMAGMNWPWPVFQYDRPQVVASGMTPPDIVKP